MASSDWGDYDREALLGQMDPKKQVNDWYTQYLGRPAGDADYAAHNQNPYGLPGIQRAIMESPERAAYLKSQEAGGTAASGTSGATGDPRTGWGFTSGTGGRGEFGYTGTDYGQDWRKLEGFDQGKLDAGFGGPDADSLKYIFARATSGLDPSSASLDEVVKRLNAQGINAKRVGADQIDFGLGEGPMDVIRGGTDAVGYHGWQWIPGAGGQPAAAAAGGGGGLPVSTTQPEPLDITSSDMNQLLMQEIQRLANGGGGGGLDRDALMRMLTR